MAHNNYSLEDIRVYVSNPRNGGKAAKIDWLCNEAGFTKRDAENTYTLIMRVEDSKRYERHERPARVRPAIRFTMGVEMETINLNRSAVLHACRMRGIAMNDEYYYHHTNNNAAYELKRDGSLSSDRGDAFEPCEIVTPVLRDLSSVKVVCDVINAAGAKVNTSCGLHVHFGAARLTPAAIKRLVINYAHLEDVIDLFMPRSRRAGNSGWCKSMRDNLDRVERITNPTNDGLRRAYGYDRYYKVNLEALSAHGTIEFRQHSGTTNFTKIENWVKFLAGLLTYSIQERSTLPVVDASDPERAINSLTFIGEDVKTYLKARHAEVYNA